MNTIQQLLKDALGYDRWEIQKPTDGMQKECYIARNTAQSVFLKFDVAAGALRRLGALGVAPKVLAHGTSGGRTFVIQEYMAGSYPSRDWIKAHITEVGSIMRTYRTDRQLTEMLSRNHTMAHDEQLHDIEKSLERHNNSQLRDLFAALRDRAAGFEAASPVPIHNEPNTKNMLLVDNKLFFIDWDEITLADPLRDAGTFAWWYVPVHQWPVFLGACGLEATDMNIAKAYWFAARAALVIYAWRLEHGYDGGGFLEDCIEALHERPNPRL